MKRPHVLLAILFLLAFLGFYLYYFNHSPRISADKEKRPNDWFFIQRAFPYPDINYQVYQSAVSQVLKMKAEAKNARLGGEWEFAGPLNIGGRVNAVAMHPDVMSTFYIGAASGGVFKTEDSGNSWDAIFDDQPSLSIGDIALAPSNPEVLYVGTGEANAGGGSVSYDGLGIFKSDDGGTSFSWLGLEESGSIGRLAVHPQKPDICYVAAMGRMFSENSQRGVFRTNDGGENWEQVLYLNDSCGAIDIVINPENPEIIYAAMWERVRRPDRRSYGGPSCGVYRSQDGGDNWEELINGLPSGNNLGRIGISLSPSNPEILYAIYADKVGYFDGVFKTTDGGDTWQQTNDGSLYDCFASYGWWFGRLRVDPVDPDIVFIIGFDLYKTSNGGNSWSNISGWDVHVDQHDLNAHPANNNFIVLGNDGGVYLSQNGGSSFTHLQNLPITQFYTCEIDFQHPERLYGGTQDNGTNRTMSGGLSDWTSIYGGDGFYVLVDPENNQYVYAEAQYGGLGRSTNGGYSFTSATNGIGTDRFNWMSPLAMDPSNPARLYFGGSKVYRSINHAASWTAISPDLSNGSGQYNQTFGTITTLAVSPLNPEIIFAGTDDGNVWATNTGGDEWISISESLPRRWITRVAANPYNQNTVYVCLSGYRDDEYLPHIYKSADLGQSWTAITGNLPELPVNDIIIDPELEGALYVATDAGVFVSWDDGGEWGLLGAELPLAPVCDLSFHPGERMLVAATYGRSMYKVYLDDFVGIQNTSIQNQDLKLFPNPATNYINIENPFAASPTLHYQIFDMAGRQVQKGSFSDIAFKLNISDLKAGMYSIIVSNSTERAEGKFTVLR